MNKLGVFIALLGLYDTLNNHKAYIWARFLESICVQIRATKTVMTHVESCYAFARIPKKRTSQLMTPHWNEPDELVPMMDLKPRFRGKKLKIAVFECRAECVQGGGVACLTTMFEGIKTGGGQFMCKENGVKTAAICAKDVLENCRGKLKSEVIESLTPKPMSDFDEACGMKIVIDNSSACNAEVPQVELSKCVLDGPIADLKNKGKNFTADNSDDMVSAVCRFWDGVEKCRKKPCGDDAYNFMTKMLKPFRPTTCGSNRMFSLPLLYLAVVAVSLRFF